MRKRVANAIKTQAAAKRQEALSDLSRHIKKPITVARLASKLKVTQAEVRTALEGMQDQGYLVFQHGDKWVLESKPPIGGSVPTYLSRKDNTYLFGFISDNHHGSKYTRQDIVESLFEHFVEQGVDRVFHAGNWIEGVSRFNRHDITHHGMDDQCQLMVDQWPKTKLTTYAISADDHEGWWAHNEGIDIGRHLQSMFKDAGRKDWVDIGFLEAFVELKNRNTGKSSYLLVMHPGGGSAYATSYAPQKIVEHLQGGEKPACLLIGHYHKMSYNMIRNVHTIQVGCCKDQDPFQRKKRIEPHLGGGICRLTQDEHGAIIGCRVEFFNYFNKGYYNARWGYGAV